MVKNLTANAGDIRDKGLTPGLGRSPEGGHGNTLQYSCLENPMDRGGWRATVHRVRHDRSDLARTPTYQTYVRILLDFHNYERFSLYLEEIIYCTYC